MTTLKEALKNKLNKYQLSQVPSSYDTIGTIALFSKFPESLKKKEKIIAKTLLKLNKNIKTVAKKTKKFSGRFRLQKIKIIAGEKTKETIHKENNVLLKLNIETCYFSPRLSNERLRIVKQIKKNETILVMFSGVAVYPIILSKKTKAKEIYAVEINPIAHKYALENLKLNKIQNVKLFKGDVKKILPKIKKKFDRIIMPLPKSAHKHLNLAKMKLKKQGTIHLYLFSNEKEFKKIKEIYSKNFKKLKLVRCGGYAPGVYRICLDLKN